MANSRYGTIRLSSVSPNDIEILVNYVSSRDIVNTLNLTRLEPASQYLKPFFDPSNKTEIVPGLYNLTLPSAIFNQLGIYTILIKPKQIRTKVLDCGSITSLPGEKGLVLDVKGATDGLGNPFDIGSIINTMSGYRIEYLDLINGNTAYRQNYFTVVTSSNKCEVVSVNQTNVTQKSTAYRLTETGNLIFLTVSPNTVSSTKPNQKPFIGEPGQSIILSNTNFDPIMLEVELVEYTDQEIGNGIYGYQTRDVDNGLVTWYINDANKTIYKQALIYEIKDEFNQSTFEVKQPKTQIDPTQNFNTITENVE